MTERDDDRAVEDREAREHFERTLGIPMPDHWERLGRLAPWALEGYVGMRSDALREPSEGGHLPVKYKNVILTAMHITEKSRWGAETYARAAIEAGATLEELAELVALTIMTNGQAAYIAAGQHALAAAEAASSGASKKPGQAGPAAGGTR